MRFKKYVAATIAAVGMTSVGLPAPAPAQTANHIVIGASGEQAALENQVGSQLALHRYGKLSGPAIVADFVNIETTVNWSQVANGGQDANIVRWADALKGQGEIWVSFSHEPMAKQNSHWGTASDFIAAFKRMVSVFDRRGATNVKWVWNVTSDSFRVPSSSWQYGAKWYPGDAYVDFVAGESYNRYKCGFPAPKSFAEQISQVLAFAVQHNKKLVVAEFASNPYAGRADWVSAAHDYMAANRSKFAGAFYYQSTNTSAGCTWRLNKDAEYAAIRTMVRGSGFGS